MKVRTAGILINGELYISGEDGFLSKSLFIMAQKIPDGIVLFEGDILIEVKDKPIIHWVAEPIFVWERAK